jgi:hypothetical protein
MLIKTAEDVNGDTNADPANEEHDLVDFEHQSNMLK